MDTLTSIESGHLSQDQTLEEERYSRLKLLGQGTYGKAFLVESKLTKQKFVCKQINLREMNEADKDRTFREALILSELSHPNIIKFKEVYRTLNSKLNIIMEYADGGDLASKIAENKKDGTSFTESQILTLFTQICLAVKHVHDRKIIHRDIKGQNVFLMANGMAKLGDFGISIILSKTLENANTVVGSPYYLSPEIIQNKPYSFKSDIWSLGVLLYEMCTSKTPFTGNSLQFLALKIVKGNYPSLPSSFSYQLRSLVKSMLHTDSARRPSVHEILKTRLISNRIKDFLSESQRHTQFSHTILHNKHIHPSKINRLINQSPDQLCPELLQLKQTESSTENEQPPIQVKVSAPEEQPEKSQESIQPQQEASKQIQISSKRFFPSNESSNPIKSPNIVSKQLIGKVYRSPTHMGFKAVSEAKPNLEGLLDIKANPIIAHPVKVPIKVYTPQVIKKTPPEKAERNLSRQRQIRAARKTEDFNFKKKSPRNSDNIVKRNSSVDQITKSEVVEQKERPQSKQLPKAPNSKPLSTPAITSKPSKDSGRSKKQPVPIKDKKNIPKTQVRKQNKLITKQVESKPKTKSSKPLEVKSQQVKKQQAAQKQKSRQKLLEDKRRSKEKKPNQSKEKPIGADKKTESQSLQVQMTNEQSLASPGYQSKTQSIYSEFEEQKYNVPEDSNQSYAFPDDYYDEPFEDFDQDPGQADDSDFNITAGMDNIPEMMESNVSNEQSEEQKLSENRAYNQQLDDSPLFRKEDTEYTLMINEMISIMNQDGLPNEIRQDSEQPIQPKPPQTETPLIQTMFDDLTYTDTANLMSGLECFKDQSKLEDLKITLQNAFGLQTFIQIYRMIQKQLQAVGLEFDDKQLHSAILSSFPQVDKQCLEKYFSIMVTLVVLQNPVVSTVD